MSFLITENEFYKQNEKIELQTKEIMKQVSDVMKIQENLLYETVKSKEEISNARLRSNVCSKILTTNVSSASTGFPENTIDEMGSKGANNFYRAKVKALQGELYRLEIDFKKKCEEVKNLQKGNQVLAQEKEKWLTSYSANKNMIGKLEAQNSSMASKCQSKEMDFLNSKKEIENLQKELKQLNMNSQNYEVRLNRLLEENGKLKTTIKTCNDEKKEINDNCRKQMSDLTATVKKIEKHKSELLKGYKKQMQLVHNLKKQQMHLETLKESDVASNNFLEMLDYKSD